MRVFQSGVFAAALLVVSFGVAAAQGLDLTLPNTVLDQIAKDRATTLRGQLQSSPVAARAFPPRLGSVAIMFGVAIPLEFGLNLPSSQGSVWDRSSLSVTLGTSESWLR